MEGQGGRVDFGFGDPFAGFGCGFGRPSSIFPSLFGGQDPFFSQPFGSMMGPTMFGPSVFGRMRTTPFDELHHSNFIEQAPATNNSIGIVIRELDEEEHGEVVRNGEGRSTGEPRRMEGGGPTRKGSSDDLSPPRQKSWHDSAEPPDVSPPRRSRKEDGNEKTQFDSTADLSPPRRRIHHDSVETRRDLVETADLSPPRRTARHDPVETADLSPPRRSRKRKSEARGRKEDDLSPPRKNRKGPSDDLSPPRKARARPLTKMGLLSSKEIREQNKKMKEQETRLLSTEAFTDSKDAEAVFRVNGKRISRNEMVKPKEKEKPKEKPLDWSKGLAQKREAEARILELEKEKNQPFARSRDDPELDKMLKETVRWGDPMAHLVKRKHTEPLLEDLGDDEKMKESGPIIPQTIPGHSWMKRGLDFPPNRYGIKPGRHWDCVDRSNGFEKEMFKRQNERCATDREAYLWSVSDM